MKRKENNFIKIEDCILRVVRVEGDFIIFEITGRECGFKTTFRISKDKLVKLGHMLNNARVISSLAFSDKIEHIHAKHREYTKCDNESQMTYKYYECRSCIIRVDSRGGYAIVCLIDDHDKVYRTMAFCVEKYAEQFKKLNRMIHDESMHQF